MPESLNPTVAALYCDFVDTQPRYVDWSAIPVEDGERTWTWAETVECPRCKRTVVAIDGCIEEHEVTASLDGNGDSVETEPCSSSGDYVDGAEGPMMNHFYPCAHPGDLADAARRIAHLPLCAVVLDGEEGIALTGGGMDLSWEICEAYILLGQCPPVHFTLPNMASRGLTERALLVLDACEASLDVVERRIRWSRDDIRRIRADYGSRSLGPANEAISDDEIHLAYALADGYAEEGE